MADLPASKHMQAIGCETIFDSRRGHASGFNHEGAEVGARFNCWTAPAARLWGISTSTILALEWYTVSAHAALPMLKVVTACSDAKGIRGLANY